MSATLSTIDTYKSGALFNADTYKRVLHSYIMIHRPIVKSAALFYVPMVKSIAPMDVSIEKCCRVSCGLICVRPTLSALKSIALLNVSIVKSIATVDVSIDKCCSLIWISWKVVHSYLGPHYKMDFPSNSFSLAKNHAKFLIQIFFSKFVSHLIPLKF